MANQDDIHERYMAAAHGVQTGVAYELEYDPSSGTPKHLRTGLNLSKVEHGALVRLLIAKGIITDEEYMEEMVKGVEEELHTYEERINKHFGVKGKIKLR